MPPHAMPPTLPGTTSVPCSDGGVKNPSDRSLLDRVPAPRAILVGQRPRPPRPSASCARASAARAGNGCVGDASSPGTSLFGTARSSTGISGRPSRDRARTGGPSSTRRRPRATSGRPCASRTGSAATRRRSPRDRGGRSGSARRARRCRRAARRRSWRTGCRRAAHRRSSRGSGCSVGTKTRLRAGSATITDQALAAPVRAGALVLPCVRADGRRILRNRIPASTSAAR